MTKIVFTDANYNYVITGGEQKLLTNDYSTCEYLCGSGVKVTSATLIKSSSGFFPLICAAPFCSFCLCAQVSLHANANRPFLNIL